MAHGKTIELRDFARSMKWRRKAEREARPRDRSLNGKARIRARKAARLSA